MFKEEFWRSAGSMSRGVSLAILGSFPGVTYVKEDDPICNILPWTYFSFCAVSTACYNSSFVFFHSGKHVRIQVNRLELLVLEDWSLGRIMWI